MEERIGDVAGSAMTDGIVNLRGASPPVKQILCAHPLEVVSYRA